MQPELIRILITTKILSLPVFSLWELKCEDFNISCLPQRPLGRPVSGPSKNSVRSYSSGSRVGRDVFADCEQRLWEHWLFALPLSTSFLLSHRAPRTTPMPVTSVITCPWTISVMTWTTRDRHWVRLTWSDLWKSGSSWNASKHTESLLQAENWHQNSVRKFIRSPLQVSQPGGRTGLTHSQRKTFAFT